MVHSVLIAQLARDSSLLAKYDPERRVAIFFLKRFRERQDVPEGDAYNLSGSWKRHPMSHTPRARKAQRSVAGLKRPSGVPSTPASQINFISKRNLSRGGVKYQGNSHAHPSSLAGLFSLDEISLAGKMQKIRLLKQIVECPMRRDTPSRFR